MAAAVAFSAAGVAAATEVEANLEVVGRTDLGGGGPFDDVAVVGTTAAVAGHCPGGIVKMVDLEDRRRPAIVASLSMPPGTRAGELDAVTVQTPSFTGDLLAASLAPCGPTTRPGVVLYDVSDPADPRALGETPACEPCRPAPATMSIAQRGDGRVLLLTTGTPGDLVVEDVTDPRHPTPLGRWSVPEAAFPWSCRPGALHNAVLHDDGLSALAVITDGRVYHLDLTDPAHPSATGEGPPPAGRSGYGAVVPVGARTLAIVADQGPDGGCPGEGGPGLRLLELSGGAPRELDPVRFTTPASPGRLVASGELAYVTWNGDGLRVIDLGAVRPRVVAQFIPAGAAVVGVGLLADHVVAVDRSSGLYVLERPEEAGGRTSFWSDLVGLLPYLGFAGILAAAFVIPRLAMGHAPGRTHVPSPAPEPSRRAPRHS